MRRGGYKENAENVRQDDLMVFCQFLFRPAEGQLKNQFPPRMVEIRGQDEGSGRGGLKSFFLQAGPCPWERNTDSRFRGGNTRRADALF